MQLQLRPESDNCECFCRLIVSVNNSQHYDQRQSVGLAARIICAPATEEERQEEESVGGTAGDSPLCLL